MRKTQRRIYASMIALCNDDMICDYSNAQICEHAGFKSPGGGITHAIEFLERDNRITRLEDGKWKVFL